MFNWFFNTLVKIAKKRNKKKEEIENENQDSQESEQKKIDPFQQANDAQDALNKLNLELEKFWNIFKNQDVVDRFNSFAKNNKDAFDHAVYQAQQNKSLRELVYATEGLNLVDERELALALVAAIIDKASISLSGTQLEEYIINRLTGKAVGANDTAIPGDVTQLFRNATRYAREYNKFIKDTHQTIDPTDTRSDDDGTSDTKTQNNTIIPDKTYDIEKNLKEDTKFNVSDNVNKILTKLDKMGYSEKYPALRSALEHFGKKQIVYEQSDDVAHPEDIELDIVIDEQGNTQKKKLYSLLNSLGVGSFTRGNDETLRNKLEEHRQESTIAFGDRYITLNTANNLLDVLRKTRGFYSMLLSREGTGYHLSVAEVQNAKDFFDKTISKMTEAGNNEDTIQEFKERVNYDFLEKILAKFEAIDAALKSKDKDVANDAKAEIRAGLRVQQKRISNLQTALSMNADTINSNALLNTQRELEGWRGKIVDSIKSWAAKESPNAEKVLATLNFVDSAFSDGFSTLRKETLEDSLRGIPPSEQNKIFANTLLLCEIEHSVSDLLKMQTYTVVDKNGNTVYPYSDLVQSFESKKLKEILQNPRSILAMDAPNQNYWYNRLVREVFPKFSEICTSKYAVDDFNRDFKDTTGSQFITYSTPFQPEKIAEDVFEDGKFLPAILSINTKDGTKLPLELARDTGSLLFKEAYSFKDEKIINVAIYKGNYYKCVDSTHGTYVNPTPISGTVIPSPVLCIDSKTNKYFVCERDKENIGYGFDENTYKINDYATEITPIPGKKVPLFSILNFGEDLPTVEEETTVDETINNGSDSSTNEETKIEIDDTTPEQDVQTGDVPTEEENSIAKEEGFVFVGFEKTAAFFKFAESEDNYTEFNPTREDNEQGLIEGFKFDEENTEDSLKEEKQQSEEFSMEKLAKVLNIIKQESSDGWDEIKKSIEQSSPKSGKELSDFAETWADCEWNASKALRMYNTLNGTRHPNSYFWKMFKNNVLPQIQSNPRVVNAIKKLSHGKPATEEDVDTVEYK